MSEKKDGGPAFPHVSRWCHQFTDDGVLIGCFPSGGGGGMSLRDWFAGQALQGIAHCDRSMGGSYTSCDDVTLHDNAKLAYQFADAMIAAREGKS